MCYLLIIETAKYNPRISASPVRLFREFITTYSKCVISRLSNNDDMNEIATA